MDKRKFLFVSLSGLIGDIAWQVLKEGHDVRYYIEAEKERDIADGFVPKSKDWEKDANWSDIIVFDDTLGQGAKAQALRASGKPVIGGTPYGDRLEDDRSFGQEQLKSAGVTIIPYEDFDSFDPAIRSSSSSAASTASKSPSALSSTARNSSPPSTSISSTKNFSPAKSVRPPVKWAPPCSGASPTSSLIAPC